MINTLRRHPKINSDHFLEIKIRTNFSQQESNWTWGGKNNVLQVILDEFDSFHCQLSQNMTTFRSSSSVEQYLSKIDKSLRQSHE